MDMEATIPDLTSDKPAGGDMPGGMEGTAFVLRDPIGLKREVLHR